MPGFARFFEVGILDVRLHQFGKLFLFLFFGAFPCCLQQRHFSFLNASFLNVGGLQFLAFLASVSAWLS